MEELVIFILLPSSESKSSNWFLWFLHLKKFTIKNINPIEARANVPYKMYWSALLVIFKILTKIYNMKFEIFVFFCLGIEFMVVP